MKCITELVSFFSKFSPMPQLKRIKTTLFNNNILSTVTSLGKYEPDNSLYDTHDTFMSLVTTCKRQSISRKK